MKVNINRQAAGLEDLLFGVGTVQQDRQGSLVTVTKINAGNMPYDETMSLAEALTPINEQIIPNLAEILEADTNASIATAKAVEASDSAAMAAALLDEFDDRYLGAKDIEPTLDNDGNALIDGALYWNSITKQMMVWDLGNTTWGPASLSATSTATLTNKTLDSITNKVGADHVHYKVRNASGYIITIGTVLTASGTQPDIDYIQVMPITDPQTQVAIGIAYTTLTNDGTGLALNTGIKDDVNTSTWAVGTILYPNTSGGFTAERPISGRYQACAYVLRQHDTQGTLLCEFTEPQMIASTTQAGYVQLNDTLTSTSDTEALTAAQGKVLQDTKITSTDLIGAIGNINSPLLDMPLKNSLAMKAGVGSATFTRASTATYIDRYGVLKTAAIDEPRFEKEGYLNEGASTNLLTYSEQFDNAAWVKNNLTVTPNTTDTLDPYGTNLADKISKSASYGRIQQTPTVSAIPHTFSVFIKAGTADTCTVRMMTGAAAEVYTVSFVFSTKTASPIGGTGTYNVIELPNGWFRISLSATFIDTTSLCIIYPDVYNTSTSGSIYIFGAQLEALPFATSYIPTVASTVTRSNDVLSVTRSENIPKDVGGTFSILCDVSSFGGTSSQGIFGIGGYSVNDYYYDGAGLSYNINGLVNSYTMTRNTVNSRIGLTTTPTTLYIVKDGVIVDTTSTTNIPTGTPTNILIGNIRTGAYPLYGHISNVRIWDKSLTAQEVALA